MSRNLEPGVREKSTEGVGFVWVASPGNEGRRPTPERGYWRHAPGEASWGRRLSGSHWGFAWYPAEGFEESAPEDGHGQWRPATLPGEIHVPALTEAQWRQKWRAEGDANRRKVDRTASLIRELKELPGEGREREICAELRADLGQSFVDDLVKAIRESQAKDSPRGDGGKTWP